MGVPGPGGAWLRRGRSLVPALALLLLVAGLGGCERLLRGQLGVPSYVIGQWQVVSEERVGRTGFRYVLRGLCMNAGGDSAGAAGLVVSRSPATVVLEDQIRCPAVSERASAPSLDTITVRHDRREPFDPLALSGIVLVWGPETLQSETRADRTRFEYRYFTYLANGLDDAQDVIATVESTSGSLEIVDGMVAGRVPSGARLAVDDGFAFRHDRAIDHDPDVLAWEIRLGRAAPSADVDGDGDVDDADVAAVESCRGRDPRQACDCARTDLDADGDVDAGDVAEAVAQRGVTGLPPRPEDVIAPTVTVTSPLAGSTVDAAPVAVSGSADEALFRLRVNGAAALLQDGAPVAWSAEAPLPAGPAALVVEALDLACNATTVTVPLSRTGGDALPPVLRLAAPPRAGAGQTFRVVAEAEDDTAVTAVAFFVDGAAVGERSVAPYVLEYVAPGVAGATLTVRAVARDAAGNEAAASAQVAVVSGDDTPPRVTALVLPAEAAPGARFLARAEAEDDRGVSEVRFALAGGATVVDLAPPYEALLTLPADAVAPVDVTATAVDAAGQEGAATDAVSLAAQDDSDPPAPVAVVAPDTALPGATVVLRGSASDAGGVARVEFLLDGLVVATDASAPYQAELPLPPSRGAGAILVWQVRATDLSGNAAESLPAVTRIVAPGAGVVLGEVYDDATARPLAGATVRVERLADAAPDPAITATTDARGVYQLALPEGEATLSITAPGASTAWRTVEVAGSALVTPLDARLAPLADATDLLRRQGGLVETRDGQARVSVPAGALAADGPVRLTRLGRQALPAPLPPGWVPLGAFAFSASPGLAAPVGISFADSGLGSAPVAARFDPAGGVWRRIAFDDAAPGGRGLVLQASGVVALLAPDAVAPPLAEVGQALAGVALADLPADAVAELSPSPRVVVADPSARSEVTLRVTSGTALPSGTPVELVLEESYALADDSVLAPPGQRQDLVVFAEPERALARVTVAPPATLDPALLLEGVIELALGARTPGASRLVGPAGARLEAEEGVSLELVPGALASEVPVSLRPLAAAAATFPFSEEDGFTLLAGVDVELGTPLAASAVLTLPLAPGDGEVLLLRQATVSGRSEWVLVARGVAAAGEVSFGAGAGALPLPGVREAGRYLAVRMAGPVGFVAGRVTRAATGVAGALVRVDSLPFVALSAPGDGAYAVAAAPGDAALDARDPATGDAAAGNASPTAGVAPAALDLALSPRSFAVTAVSPSAGEAAVGVGAVVVARLSGEVDATSLDATTASLLVDGAPVAVGRALAADRGGVVLRPAAPLAGATRHVVRLGAGLRDVLGRPLAGSPGDGAFESAFTTVDTAPPPRPAAGLVTLSIPADGTSLVSGSVGAAPPGAIVSVRNETSGVVKSVLAGPDGSFTLEVEAAPSDTIRLALVGASGEVTELEPIPFSDGDGGFVLGPLGGSASTPSGLRARLLPGAWTGSGTLRVQDLAPGALPVPLPAGLAPVAAFTLELDPALFGAVDRVTVDEESGRFASQAAFPTPARVDATRVTADTVGPASRFSFRATVRDASGATRVVTVDASGRATACGERGEARDDTAAPRLRLEAPTCLGPSEAFSLVAEAAEPRLDVSAPLAAGAPDDGSFLVLGLDDAGAGWQVVEVATVRDTPSGPVVESLSRAPFGIRSGGRYAIVRSADPLAFVEGRVAGDAARVGSEGSPLATATDGSNQSFLLAVPAGSPVQVQVRDVATGDVVASREQAALAAGETARIGRLGAAAAGLAVEAELPPSGTLAGRAPLRLVFDAPVDLGSITPATLIVTDPRGRAVEGARRASGDGRRVDFVPARPWRFGEDYAVDVTTDVLSRSGAALDVRFEASFSGFAPLVRALLPGADVKDAAVDGVRAYVLDETRLRSLDLSDPEDVTEGTPVGLDPIPNRLLATDPGTPAAALLVAAGALGDYGTLARFGLPSPLAPARELRRRLSTPSGAPPVAGAAARPGDPIRIALLAEGAVGDATPEPAAYVSTRGIGLQRLALSALGDTGTLPAVHPDDDAGASFTDVAAGGGRVVSIGSDGLQVHDATTLAPLGAAAVDGTPVDVAVAEVEGRLLALVAAGLPGGVQVYAIDPEGVPERVARVLTGCGTARVAVDAALARGWLACTGARVGAIDLADVDGLDREDADADGRDDRLAGLVELPGALSELDLDRPRALALLSQGPSGLSILQTGPAEAVIQDVRRDVLPGGLDQEISILRDGRAFFGDQALAVDLEVRIPPGHPGLRAVLEGDAPLAFAGGGTEQALSAGAQRLLLLPQQDSGDEEAPFTLRIVEEAPAGGRLAAFAGSLAPIPLDALVSVTAEDVVIDSAEPRPVALYGTGEDDNLYHVTPLAQLAVTEPAVGTVDADGRFTPRAGGEAEVVYTVAGRRASFLVESSLPPGVALLRLSPRDLPLRTGEEAPLTVELELSDGTVRAAEPEDGIVFTSSAPEVATVADDGTVRAVAAGEATIEARAGEALGYAFVSSTEFVPPDVAGLALTLERDAVFTDVGAVGAYVELDGTGSLGRIEVAFRLEGFGPPRETVVETLPDGSASVVFGGLDAAGTGALSARAVDPADGTVFEEARDLAVRQRNSDTEPNGDTASAILLEPGAAAEGTVGGADAVDVYRFERMLPGTLRLRVEGEGVTATLVDAGGAPIGDPALAGAPLETAVEASTEPLFVRVAAGAADSAYAVSVQTTPVAPGVTGVEPAFAPQGATVVIRGSGFSPDPDRNTVQFDGLATEVLSATPTELEVVVPAFASGGSVVVWTGSQESNPIAFSTGEPTPWTEQVLRTPFTDQDVLDDPETGNAVLRERIVVSFRPTVLRPAVEALADQLGAEIIEIWPPLNEYTLRIPGASLDDLRAQVRSLQARPDVDYALLAVLPEIDAFPVAGRDDFPGQQFPFNPTVETDARLSGAYAQIHAFEAWQWLTDHGRFSKQSDFGPVRVAVIDTDFTFTDASEPQLARPQITSPVDLSPVASPAFGSHGVSVVGVIGARNVDDGLRRSTGILGGVIPADAPLPHFYQIDHYGASTNSAASLDSSEIDAALAECPPPPPDGPAPPCPNPRPMDVVNLSLGSYNTSATWLKRVKNRPNAFFVTSAGNANKDAGTHCPSCLTNNPVVGDRVISVAAVGNGYRQEPKDSRADTRASFSNYGNAVDIAAPGENVLTVSITPEKKDVCRGEKLLPVDNPFDFFCGTSAAAPLVAGTAGLLKAISPTLTPQELKKLLIESATPLKGVPIATTWGAWATPRRLDVLRAVQLALRHRDIAEGEDSNFVPGTRRDLWLADRPNGSLVKLEVGSFTEDSLDPGFIEVADPVSVAEHGCAQPFATAISQTGQKLYIACRGSDEILVWHTATNAPADFAESPSDESRISLNLGLTSSYSLPNFPSIQMAISREGTVLAVPIAGRRVAFIDTRTDRVMSVRKFRPEVNVGEVRALAFGSDDALYAVLSEQNAVGVLSAGMLVKQPRLSTGPVWPINSPFPGLLKRVALGNPFDSPRSDGPRGVAILTDGGTDQVYVNYGGARTLAAATAHRASTLSLLNPPGALNGRIRANLPDRIAQQFQAGDLVANAIGSFTSFRRFLETGTSRAEGFAIDSQRKRGYLLFRGTNNIGLVKPHTSGSFQQMSSVTRIGGEFVEPRTEQRAVLLAAVGADGSVNAEVQGNLRARDSRLYFQDQFPVSYGMNQEGSLLASFLAGRRPALRLWSTERLRDADTALFDAGDDPTGTTLDEKAADPVFVDLDTGVDIAPALSFAPVLTIATPASGAITRGAIAVHPTTRTSNLEEFRCEVRKASNDSLVASDAGTTVGVDGRLDGLLDRTGGADTGSPIPICRFPDLPRGRFVLRVIAKTLFDEPVVAETPFKHEKW